MMLVSNIKKMELLCIDKRYKEAIAIGERTEFSSDISIQLKLVEAYMGIKDYDKARAICLRPEFVNLPGFIQKNERIKIEYIKKIEGLIKESNNSKNPQWKAQGYCTNKAFENDVDAALYHVKILIMLKNYESAWEIINDERFKDNKDFFLQEISMLINIKKYNEALSLIDNSIFRDDPQVINRKQSILLRKMNSSKNIKLQVKGQQINNEQKEDFVVLLEKIENKSITINEIQERDISQILKDVLTIAFCEIAQQSKVTIREYLKEIIVKYQDSEECLSVIGDLERHFIKKNFAYDKYFYLSVLQKANNIRSNKSR